MQLVVAMHAELPAGFEDFRGRVFQGRYELDELLHATPWHVTFGGRERDTDRAIVVDLMRPSPLHDQATVERFERRVAACGRVRHPVIHTPSDSGELADGKLYVVCDRPAGEPLDRHLEERPPGRLDWMTARLLLLELVRGLGAAHTRRVVHGSLSPGCCWIERSAFGVPSLRVLGFGVNTGPLMGVEELTHSRTNVVGHDAVFMAPESVGGVFGDEQSDVYMAGLVAWFMLVGRPPYQGVNAFQLASLHLTAPVPSMRDAGVDVPTSVDALVQRMLAKHPQQRPAGMGEIEHELYELDEGDAAGLALNPEAARGRAGRARARGVGTASREEAVQRLVDKDGSAGLVHGARPRLPGQEIVDARRSAARPTSVPPQQAMPVVPRTDESLAASPVEPPWPLGQDDAGVDPTQHIDGFVAITDAPAREESTMLLELPNTHSSPPDMEGTMVLSQLYERSSDAEAAMALPLSYEDNPEVDGTVILTLHHERERDAAAAKPPMQASLGTVPFTPEQVRALRASAKAEASVAAPSVAAPSVVTGGTQRMSPSEIRALRLAALTGGSTSAPAAPTSDVEGTQILSVEPHDDAAEAQAEQEVEEQELTEEDVLEVDVEPDEEPEVDLEDQQTNALSPAQVAALRRQYGRRGPRERGR